MRLEPLSAVIATAGRGRPARVWATRPTSSKPYRIRRGISPATRHARNLINCYDLGSSRLVKYGFMPLSPELLEILVCPVCKESLELKPDGSGLKCTKCRRVYPIRDEIPVMLVDQARIED